MQTAGANKHGLTRLTIISTLFLKGLLQSRTSFHTFRVFLCSNTNIQEQFPDTHITKHSFRP